MADTTALGTRLSNLEVSPQFEPYSKVIINIDEETAITVGDDTGRALEINNPFGTEEMANAMLASLRGYQYQPYEAEGAHLDPAAEIGDGVSMKGNYGGIYKRNRAFGRLMKAEIAAPEDEEIDHEYQFESPTDRRVRREFGNVKASLLITNNMIQSEVTRASRAEGELSSRITQTEQEISANVVARENTNYSSFGWSLTASGHKWYANGTEVMSVTASGLTVNGTINSTSGTIGGFSIGRDNIHNGVESIYDIDHDGVYIGTNGIRLGRGGAFNVDSGGSLTAFSASLTNCSIDGNLTVGGYPISAYNLYNGANQASSNYSSWNSTASTVGAGSSMWNSTASTVSGGASMWNSAAYSTSAGGYCYTGAGYGYNFNSATYGSYVSGYWIADSIVGRSGGTLGSSTGSSVVIKGRGVYWTTINGVNVLSG